MNRWLVALLVFLAVIVLISPGIIGRFAEQNMQESIEWVESESPGVVITTETFDRSWFTSEGRHKVVFSGGQFQAAIDNYTETTGNPEFPSLIIDTRIDHGLVPVTSLSRDSGSLAPGLANTISTFQVDPGDGELMELPGTLYSNVSLTGASDSRLLLESGNYDFGDTRIDWEGADLSIYTDRGDGELGIHGSISPWTMNGDDGDLKVGAININADQTMTDYGFNVGPAEVSVGAIVASESSNSFTIGGMKFTSDSDIDDGRLNSNANLSVNDVDVPSYGNVAMTMDLALNRLDAASFGKIVEALQNAQAENDPEMAIQSIMPNVQGDLEAMAAAGAEVRIENFNVTLPQGTVATNLVIDVPENDDPDDFSWPGVLLGMTASMDLRVPTGIYELAAMMNPQAEMLLAMGVLKKEGDDYVMEAEYAQGLITVNGAPMPIPIPGL